VLNLYYFECIYDVIYEAESALCNINKHHLQLNLQFILFICKVHPTRFCKLDLIIFKAFSLVLLIVKSFGTASYMSSLTQWKKKEIKFKITNTKSNRLSLLLCALLVFRYIHILNNWCCSCDVKWALQFKTGYGRC
jgi:hypothetical protein